MRIKRKVKNKMLNKMMIGLGYGIVKSNNLLLNKELGISPQDAMDTLSLWVGREIMKGLLDEGVIKLKDGPENFVEALTEVINISEDLDIDIEENKIKIVVQNCAICPKKIGGYDLGSNTACPVGGLIVGGLTYALGTSPIISKNHLQTGQICHIAVDLPSID